MGRVGRGLGLGSALVSVVTSLLNKYFCDGSVRAWVGSVYVCFRPLSTRSIYGKISDSRSYHNRPVPDTIHSASSNAAVRPNSPSQRSVLTSHMKRQAEGSNETRNRNRNRVYSEH